jgi:hypothetical protein
METHTNPSHPTATQLPIPTNYTKIGYNPIVREEIIRGEDAIRQAIQHWRQHLITHWRNEPLRLTQATPNAQPPFHRVEFQNGHAGWLGYMGNDARYPLYWGCNLVRFQDYEPPEILAIGIDKVFPDWHQLPAIGRFRAVLPAIYDPVLLLFYHLADSSLYGLAQGEPITAHEIVKRSEQVFQERKQDNYGNDWVSVGGFWYPAELLTIARERL